ncbi:MAG: LysE family transporter [Roseomonas sp.]|nr:LysE family transporter [Roseomonas sp.]
MLALAALPGVSVATVVSQAVAGGWRAALACTVGILLGDGLYLAVALFGLAWIESVAERWAWLLALCGGLYLLLLGAATLRTKPAVRWQGAQRTTLLRSMFAGLGITLTDQKAILFYLAFVPAFIELQQATLIDLLLLVGTMMVAVAVPKLAYAALAAAMVQRSPAYATVLYRIAGGVILSVGAWLVVRGSGELLS